MLTGLLGVDAPLGLGCYNASFPRLPPVAWGYIRRRSAAVCRALPCETGEAALAFSEFLQRKTASLLLSLAAGHLSLSAATA